MALKILQNLKKKEKKEFKREFHRFVVVGNSIFSMNSFQLLKEQFASVKETVTSDEVKDALQTNLQEFSKSPDEENPSNETLDSEMPSFFNENVTDLKKAGLSGFIQKPFKDYELSKLLGEIL